MNEIAQEYHFAAIERDQYDVTKFQRALANAAFNEPGLSFTHSLVQRCFSFLVRQVVYGTHR